MGIKHLAYAAICAIAAMVPASAQEVHIAHCLHGCPIGAPATNETIVREIYVLSNNGTRKFADWVAYRVTRDTIGPTRPRNWKADPFLDPGETLEPTPNHGDYQGANAALATDRGHQVRLAAFTGTPYWRDTNYLSNITPQMADLNQGPWEALESAVRSLAQQTGVNAVHAMTGPLYESAMPSLPSADEPHTIPSGYWKIIVVEGGTTEIAAYAFNQNTARSANFCLFVTDVFDIEQRTGLNFFPQLSANEQAALEIANASLAPRLGC